MLDTTFDFQNLNRKETLNKSGIYAIVCMATNKMYIGQAKNLYQRFCTHKSGLLLGKHENDYLQKAFDKYGINEFNLKILEFCDKSDLNVAEKTYMDLYDTTNHSKGYNLSYFDADGSPRRHLLSINRIKVGKYANKKFKFSDIKVMRELFEEGYNCKIIAKIYRHNYIGVVNIINNTSYNDPNYTKPIPKKLSLIERNTLDRLKYSNQGLSKISKITGINKDRIRAYYKEVHNHKLTRSAGVEVINVETGILYNTISEAADSTGYIGSQLLWEWLVKYPKNNKSNLRLV